MERGVERSMKRSADWLSLPRPLFGLIFGGLTPREADTSAKVVCREFARVKPVWLAVDMADLDLPCPILRCEVARVQSLKGWFGCCFEMRVCLRPRPRLDWLHWTFHDFPALRFCDLRVPCESLARLAKAVESDAAFDLQLRLVQEYDPDMFPDIIPAFKLLERYLVGLDFAEFEDSVWRVVPALSRLSRLTALDVSGHPEVVDDFPQLPSCLQKLSCRGTDLDDSCVDSLARFSDLTELDVSWTSITNVRFARVLPHLRSLSLRGTGVTDLEPLASLRKLESVDLGPSELQDALLQAALPGCQVLRNSEFKKLF